MPDTPSLSSLSSFPVSAQTQDRETLTPPGKGVLGFPWKALHGAHSSCPSDPEACAALAGTKQSWPKDEVASGWQFIRYHLKAPSS